MMSEIAGNRRFHTDHSPKVIPGIHTYPAACFSGDKDLPVGLEIGDTRWAGQTDWGRRIFGCRVKDARNRHHPGVVAGHFSVRPDHGQSIDDPEILSTVGAVEAAVDCGGAIPTMLKGAEPCAEILGRGAAPGALTVGLSWSAEKVKLGERRVTPCRRSPWKLVKCVKRGVPTVPPELLCWHCTIRCGYATYRQCLPKLEVIKMNSDQLIWRALAILDRSPWNSACRS